ncbi:MAG TPA: 2-oxoglutarate dehydrogenase E1 component [Candidatus Limnocylindrales bacterium]|nr:2-oxoglutarate dehydrogenase E1 component [Candidatus Limnocylindrales bacterium]
MADNTQNPNTLSLPFVEGLYAEFLRDPSGVPPEWRGYFERIAESNGFASNPRLSPSFPRRSLFGRGPVDGRNGSRANAPFVSAELEPSYVGAPRDGALAAAPAPFPRPAPSGQKSAYSLIQAYRLRGHLAARIDPLESPRPEPPDLDPRFHGFTESDLDQPVSDSLGARAAGTLRELIARLRAIYCGPVGIQYNHIHDVAVRAWLEARFENVEFQAPLAPQEERRVLERLTAAAIFEEFIQRKYIGSKSFSLEGSESLIPLLDAAVEAADAQGLSEVVFGMAHRGRLNVLANVLGKEPSQIFYEFEDQDPELYHLRGDVKYHLGYSKDRVLPSGRSIHLSLCYNPSHLEFVDPVALGRVRAKQDQVGDGARERGMALLMHGDAAFAGEGVVQETLNLSALPGYETGGTLHVIVNNQIGFTTIASDARSTPYASDVARMLQSPIFHVNGEEPDAVIRTARLAMEFRREFRRDVVIDLYGYRRHGHNEGDEPAFTQPLLYKAIAARKPIHVLYGQRLAAAGSVPAEEAAAMVNGTRALLEAQLTKTRSAKRTTLPDAPDGVWARYRGGPDSEAPETDTGVPADKLAAFLKSQTVLPDGFAAHPKILRGLAQRREMAEGKRPLDWSAAESLAFGTLAVEGHRVRVSGQDTERGTFSQRHDVLHDVNTGALYIPLQHLAPDQAAFEILNSPLSEAGAMGFEYGYSLETPNGLVAWEAQFGDFANAAQVIIDQFLTSGEEKWRRLSGLVLLLPHGWEGLGSEHSSARIERFLQLAARDNIQVANPSTPAQYFHLLRRQVKRPWRKPLVVVTPKSLLRNPEAVSPMSDLAAGRFQRAIGDLSVPPAQAKRVLFCSGKIYYELARARSERSEARTAILRLEQLYPLADETLTALFRGIPEGTPITWVQEEPRNMGAWPYLRARYGERMLGRHPLRVISRDESATPASGAASSNKIEQERLVSAAFDKEPAAHGG